MRLFFPSPDRAGVVHVINSVLLPASATSTIVDLAVASPNTFSTLVDLVTTAGLAQRLSGGALTVFAPTSRFCSCVVCFCARLEQWVLDYLISLTRKKSVERCRITISPSAIVSCSNIQIVDAAFAKLPAGTLETLKAPENREKLRDILTYHVAGRTVVTSDMLEEGMYVKMLNDKTAPVSLTSGAKIGNAKVVTADILAKNG